MDDYDVIIDTDIGMISITYKDDIKNINEELINSAIDAVKRQIIIDIKMLKNNNNL